MPVTLINGSVLMPHPADWSGAVEWQRTWQTGISSAITGAEARQALRALAREQLTYFITAISLEERAELDERLDAAVKSGLVCAPFWGRGSVITGWPENNAALMADNIWPWAVGDYAFLMGPNLTPKLSPAYPWCVVQISSISQSATADSTATTADSTLLDASETGATVLTLAGPITADNTIITADSTMEDASQSFLDGALLWPMLFGKFSMDKQAADTSWRGNVKVTLSELAARHQPSLGTPPAGPGTGIGAMAIGSTFIVG